MILFVVFFVIIVLSLLNINRKEKVNLSYYFILITLVILSSIRFKVGGDSMVYYDKFNENPTFYELFSFNFKDAVYNPSWYIFNGIAKGINNSFYTFQLLHAIVVNVVIFWFIAKYAVNRYAVLPFYFFLYFCYFNMEILREALAIAVFLTSLPAFFNKNWIKYYVLALVAMSFHNSALVVLVFPLFYLKLSIRYQILIFIVTCIITGVLVSGNFLFMLGLDKIFGSNSLFYLNKEMNLIGSIFQLLKLVPVYYIYYVSKQKKLETNFDKFIFPYIIIGIAGSFIPGVYRFMNYFAIPILIYCVNQLYVFYTRRQINALSFFKIQFSMVIIVFFQVYYLLQDQSELSKVAGARKFELYLPYYTIFNEQIHDNRERIFYSQFEGNL